MKFEEICPEKYPIEKRCDCCNYCYDLYFEDKHIVERFEKLILNAKQPTI